ncbi:MAG: hypothetical protein ACP5R6_03410 [Chlorobaculum sp.]
MDKKLKHLEFIQGVVNRLSTNSFLLKGWSVVLVSALFALSANNSNVKFIMLAYIPAVVFWGLDGYFLSLERIYRQHYERVRTKSPDEIDFSMDTNDIQGGINEWASATLSKTLIPFHGSLIGAIIVVMLIQL